MGFLPLNAKPGKRGKLRPIIRDRWAQDYVNSAVLATNNGGRALLKAPNFLENHTFDSGSSGQQVPGSGVGGGEV